MRHFNIKPFSGLTVGFDRLQSLIDSTNLEVAKYSNPYNIERIDENSFRIILAVPGFGIENLTIEANESVLSVKGEIQESEEDKNFVFRGLSIQEFEQRFQLEDNIKVKGANLENGLLHIDLIREIPEASKPHKIEISVGGSDSKQIDGMKVN